MINMFQNNPVSTTHESCLIPHRVTRVQCLLGRTLTSDAPEQRLMDARGSGYKGTSSSATNYLLGVLVLRPSMALYVLPLIRTVTSRDCVSNSWLYLLPRTFASNPDITNTVTAYYTTVSSSLGNTSEG